MSTQENNTVRHSASGLFQFLSVAVLLAVLFIAASRYGGPLLAGLSTLARPAQTQIDKLSVPRLPAPGTIRGGQGYARPEVQQQMEAQPAPAEEAPRVYNAPTLRADSLPTNERGAPVISEDQARQLNQAADLAAQEWQAAADEQARAALDQRRESERAAPVKMDAEQVEQTYGRDPCSVPRADPKTCGLGVPQATPLNTQP